MILEEFVEAILTTYVGVNARGEIIKTYSTMKEMKDDRDPEIVSRGITESDIFSYSEVDTIHTHDAHCTVDSETDTCSICGVYHGYPCEECFGTGFHSRRCSQYDV